MVRRVPPEAALLGRIAFAIQKGVWGKNLCRQIEKNNAIRNAQGVLATARNRGMLTIFVNIGWRPGFPELPENQYYPLLQGAKDENKGIVGTWEVDVIDALRPMTNEPIVINFGSDSFEGTDLDRILRAANVGHLFISGQCIEHDGGDDGRWASPKSSWMPCMCSNTRCGTFSGGHFCSSNSMVRPSKLMPI
jgi:Isochorismatase family